MDTVGRSHEIAELEAQITGTEVTTIDEKGRIRLPRKMHVALGDPFVLYVNPAGCISAYPVHRWNARVRAIYSLPEFSKEREIMSRDLGPNAEVGISADAQGRFVLPKRLRQLAGLETDEVVLIGCIDSLEIWTPEDRAAYMADPDSVSRSKRREAFESAAEKARGN
jgi:MraZ protein